MANKIDFGQWTVPEDWSQISLRQFQDIRKYYEDEDKPFDIRDVVQILVNKTRDEVDQLPVEFLEVIMDKMSFIEHEPTIADPTNKITINGEEYMINIVDKLKTGEYVAADSVMKADKYDFASVLAILCRKDGEVYDSRFEAENFEARKKMFEDEPAINIFPLLAFFLNCYVVSQTHSLLYSQVEEAVNLTQQSIDSSTGIGGLRRRYLNWQMKRLRKSLTSNRPT